MSWLQNKFIVRTLLGVVFGLCLELSKTTTRLCMMFFILHSTETLISFFTPSLRTNTGQCLLDLISKLNQAEEEITIAVTHNLRLLFAKVCGMPMKMFLFLYIAFKELFS